VKFNYTFLAILLFGSWMGAAYPVWGQSSSGGNASEPTWLYKIPQSEEYLFAVGRGNSDVEAENAARASIAQQAGVTISSEFRRKILEVQKGETIYFNDASEHQVEAVAQLTVAELEVVDLCRTRSGGYGCLVRVPRKKIFGLLDQQQENYRQIVLGYISEGEKAEEKGRLGSALKHYLKAYSVLPRLPYSLPIKSPADTTRPRETRAFLHEKTLGLLGEMRCRGQYLADDLNPAQSRVALQIQGRESGRVFDRIAVLVRGNGRQVKKETDGEGALQLYADGWRKGIIIHLEIDLQSESFPPFEDLADSARVRFFDLIRENYLGSAVEVGITAVRGLRIFLEIDESIDGESFGGEILIGKLRPYFSRHPEWYITREEERADLKLMGNLKSALSENIAGLGMSYKSTGEVALSFSESDTPRVFSLADRAQTKAFGMDAADAGRKSLTILAEILFQQIAHYVENDFKRP
jgi:hypothetical protein